MRSTSSPFSDRSPNLRVGGECGKEWVQREALQGRAHAAASTSSPCSNRVPSRPASRRQCGVGMRCLDWTQAVGLGAGPAAHHDQHSWYALMISSISLAGTPHPMLRSSRICFSCRTCRWLGRQQQQVAVLACKSAGTQCRRGDAGFCPPPFPAHPSNGGPCSLQLAVKQPTHRHRHQLFPACCNRRQLALLLGWRRSRAAPACRPCRRCWSRLAAYLVQQLCKARLHWVAVVPDRAACVCRWSQARQRGSMWHWVRVSTVHHLQAEQRK